MRWTEEQLDTISNVYKEMIVSVIIHCEDRDDEIRVRKYMQKNHPVVDYEVVIDEH